MRGSRSRETGPRRPHRAILIAATAVLLLSSCAPGTAAPTASPDATPSPTASETPSPTPSPSVEPTEPSSPTPVPSECPTDWGTNAETEPDSTSASITDVRAGRHDCFDRLVTDVNGDVAGYDVRYVTAVSEQGSGEAISLRGSAFLQVTVLAPAYDPVTGEETYPFSDDEELADVGGFESFRQVAWAGSFEGQTVIGLGLTSQLPFRVFTLEGPGSGSRVVVDVAH